MFKHRSCGSQDVGAHLTLRAESFAIAVPETTRIGFVGLGVMGQSMCAHLVRAGYKATVFNRTASKVSFARDICRFPSAPFPHGGTYGVCSASRWWIWARRS